MAAPGRFEPPAGTPATVRPEFELAILTRDAAAVRRLLAAYPGARALLDAPLFPFDAPALVHVAGSADVPFVQLLIELGADPNRRSDWWAGGWHVLHTATGEVAERLLAAGAVPDACAAAHVDRLDLLERLLDEDPVRVHERGGDGQTPLHFARSRAVVDLLLERGADPDARDLDHRATPAQWMLDGLRGAGRYELAAYLVERGASADVFLAAALGLTTRLRELLAADASLLDRRTGQGEYGEQPPASFHIYTWTIGANLSPLRVAARFDQPEALALLREHATPRQLFLDACARGDAAEARSFLAGQPGLMGELAPEDLRALPDAALEGRPAAVELMLQLDFDPATPGELGGTTLHCAAIRGDPAPLEVALRHPTARALVDHRDANFGGTPLGWCCYGAVNWRSPGGDYPAVARLLLDAGAEPPDSLDGVPEELAAVFLAHRNGGDARM